MLGWHGDVLCMRALGARALPHAVSEVRRVLPRDHRPQPRDQPSLRGKR